nr:PREDICTED: uncharacterized protein LOC105668170 [Linepithema humile]
MCPPIVGNSAPATVESENWTIVARGKNKGRKKGIRPSPPTIAIRVPSRATPKEDASKQDLAKKARKRLPRSAAVRLVGQGNLAEALLAAKREIVLEELGVNKVDAKRSQNGGILVEIPGGGRDAEAQACCLTFAIQMALQKNNIEGVRVSRPTKRMDLRLSGVEETVSEEGIRQAIAAKGGCSESEIRVGPLRLPIRGKHTIWAQGPARAMVKVAEAGRIAIGWSSSVRAELMSNRPARCFRCLARGHIQQRCPSKVDRALCCF